MHLFGIAMEGSIKHLPFVRILRGENFHLPKDPRGMRRMRKYKCEMYRVHRWISISISSIRYYNHESSFSQSLFVLFFSLFYTELAFLHPVKNTPHQCWNIIKMLNAREYGICFCQTTRIPIYCKQFALLQPIPLSLSLIFLFLFAYSTLLASFLQQLL